MSEWEVTTLGEVAHIMIGKTPPRKSPEYWTDDLAYPFCTIADMDNHWVDPRREGITKAAIDEGKAKLFPAGSLMMSFKLSIGRIGFAARDIYPNEAIARLEPHRKDLNERFLAIALEGQDLTAGSGRAVKGNTLNRDSMRAIPIRFPSPSEQHRIIDVMAAVDAQIEALADELRTLDPLRVRLFLDSDDLQYVAVDEIANVSQGKALPKRVQSEKSGDISWFKIADMTASGNEDGYTCADTRLAAEHVDSLKGVVVPAGSIAFPRVGAAVLTEKKRILDVDAAVDENHLVLTPKAGVSAECLLAAIESIRLADLVQTGAVPSLNMGLIRNAQIPWSIEANDRLSDALCEIRANTRGLRTELADLRGFRTSFLSALLSQEIEIPESYNALLEEVA